MQSQKQLLTDISEHKHKTAYGTDISKELLQIFRIKNLFLYSFKLLQRYQLLTTHACAQISKNVLMRQLEEQEKEIQQLETQLNYMKEVLSSFKEKIESLRQQLSSMDNHYLPSGLSKVNTLCALNSILIPDLFVNCDDLFYKKFNESNLNIDTINLLSQRPPIEFYQDLIYLQLHFHLLIVQGCNFALPLLTTKLSFISRIIYWPSKPFYGFENKSKKLKEKLLKVKLQLTARLDELINAIGEVEKWILFYQNSHQVYNTLMKAACNKKKELLYEMNLLKSSHYNLTLEHNRLVGAILKNNPHYFRGNDSQLNLNLVNQYSQGLFLSSSTDSLSAFSLNSVKVPDQKQQKNIDLEISFSDKQSDIFNANALTSLQQIGVKKLSSDGTLNKPPIQRFSKEKIFNKQPQTMEFNNEFKVKKSIVSDDLVDNLSLKKGKSHSQDSLNSIKTPESNKSLSLLKEKPVSIYDIFNKSFFKCKSISTISSITTTAIKIPAIEKLPGRIKNISSTPGDALHCQCVKHMPPIEEIKKALLGKRKSENQNNQFLHSIFQGFTNDNNKNKPLNTGIIFQHIKSHPKFEKINQDIQENLTLLNKLSDDNNSNVKHNGMEFVESSVIWNSISARPHRVGLSNSNRNETDYKDYYDILNMFLESCGMRTENYSEISLNRDLTKNLTNNIFNSLDLEHEFLTKTYSMNSFTLNGEISPIISTVEAQLFESLKLYSKYLN